MGGNDMLLSELAMASGLRFEGEATAAPVFFSDNGGLSFSQLNPVAGDRSGEATAVEARANLRELGWTARDWTAGAWWRDVDAGFIEEARHAQFLGDHAGTHRPIPS